MAKDKMFKKAMEVKYCQEFGTNQNRGSNVTNITDKTAKYLRLGYTQSPRKVEMAAAGAKITAKRGGVQAYDPYLHLAGIPLGQRQLTPYTVSGTNTVCEGDDLHFVNNAAMQQMWDDIRRTCVVGLDIAHETLEKRLGKEVTPETIAYYLDVVNHALPGAAIVQEHMVETHPALVDDCYLKVFTGDDELKDELPRQYVIDIDKEVPANQAKQIKASIGKTSWQAAHMLYAEMKDIPTCIAIHLEVCAPSVVRETMVGMCTACQDVLPIDALICFAWFAGNSLSMSITYWRGSSSFSSSSPVNTFR